MKWNVLILLGSKSVSVEIQIPERWKLDLMLQNILRSLATTKFYICGKRKMLPEAVYKFRRRRQARF